MADQQVPFSGIPFPVTGRVLVFPPMSLGICEDYEDRIAAFLGGREPKPSALVVDITLACLQRNYPDLTRDEVRNWLDATNVQDLFTALLRRSGYVSSGAEGNGVAEAVSPGTGVPSTPNSAQPSAVEASTTTESTGPSPTTAPSAGTGESTLPFTSASPPTSGSGSAQVPVLLLDNLPPA